MAGVEIRNSVKIILLNDDNELLLQLCDNPDVRYKGDKARGRFWAMIGGKIEPGETILQAAKRELFEETGIRPDAVKFGKIVWYGEFDMFFGGKSVYIAQKFMVAHTSQKNFSLDHIADTELCYVRGLKWFNLEEIIRCEDIIYPIVLRDNIASIMEGKIPPNPIELDLAKLP